MEYKAISTDTLIDNSSTDFTLYVRIGNDLINYTRPGHEWSKDELNNLLGKGFEKVWIKGDDSNKYNNYIELNTFKKGASHLSPSERISSIQDVGMSFSKCIFESELTPEAMGQANFISDQLISTLLEDISSVQAIKGLASHDYYTYHHSVRVATYSIATAITLGITDQLKLKEIALGGILHDIGKKDISMNIINKTGALTNKEWELMKAHPEAGHEIVQHSELSDISQKIILSHHEKLDGSGYPYGLEKSNIPDQVQITTIADIFDALTSSRSYQNERPRFEALTLMKEKMVGDKLDLRFFNALVHCFKEKP
jgi:putative nucleotidyltransferase with HDIG domain